MTALRDFIDSGTKDGWLKTGRHVAGQTIAKVFAAAPTGEASHLATLYAGTLPIRIGGLCRVAAAEANEAILRSPDHEPELAALHAIRAADDIFNKHSFAISFHRG